MYKEICKHSTRSIFLARTLHSVLYNRLVNGDALIKKIGGEFAKLYTKKGNKRKFRSLLLYGKVYHPNYSLFMCVDCYSVRYIIMKNIFFICVHLRSQYYFILYDKIFLFFLTKEGSAAKIQCKKMSSLKTSNMIYWVPGFL